MIAGKAEHVPCISDDNLIQIWDQPSIKPPPGGGHSADEAMAWASPFGLVDFELPGKILRTST